MWVVMGSFLYAPGPVNLPLSVDGCLNATTITTNTTDITTTTFVSSTTLFGFEHSTNVPASSVNKTSLSFYCWLQGEEKPTYKPKPVTPYKTHLDDGCQIHHRNRLRQGKIGSQDEGSERDDEAPESRQLGRAGLRQPELSGRFHMRRHRLYLVGKNGSGGGRGRC
ncbi:hypothetical protein GWK47_011732 [Chionoecetes opilio]|uniref:Uncharacterized protein n=1 Tax=Chionoecetes opilio TaxID=41210 RepID=A0A8J5CMZ7_CHIOP|nr:hypothetical protein GWK47_011732 [Chionoecetes opilio]